MHPLVEKIIRQLSENEYLVKMKSGDLAIWSNMQYVDEEVFEYQDLDYLLAVAG